MIVLVLSGLIGLSLFLILARFGAPKLKARLPQKRRPVISASSLRALVVELLRSLGLTVESADSDERHLMATQHAPLGEMRHVVLLAAAPPGGVVDQAEVRALAEDVKAERAAGGMLITPGEIDTGGLADLDVRLELVDGARFRRLLAEHLPARLGELDPTRQ